MFDRNTGNHLTVRKQLNSDSFKILRTNYSFTNYLMLNLIVSVI